MAIEAARGQPSALHCHSRLTTEPNNGAHRLNSRCAGCLGVCQGDSKSKVEKPGLYTRLSELK